MARWDRTRHRFTVDEDAYIQAMRLCKVLASPEWTAVSRSQVAANNNTAARKTYGTWDDTYLCGIDPDVSPADAILPPVNGNDNDNDNDNADDAKEEQEEDKVPPKKGGSDGKNDPNPYIEPTTISSSEDSRCSSGACAPTGVHTGSGGLASAFGIGTAVSVAALVATVS